MSTKRTTATTKNHPQGRARKSPTWPSSHTQALLAGLGPVALVQLLGGAADIVLLVDAQGVVCDLHADPSALAPALAAGWLGQPLTELVSPDSQTKVQALCDLQADQRWRHVNHLLADGSIWPVQYQARPLGDGQHQLFFGRDMRSLSVLQQRLVEAQHQVETDFARLRHAEARASVLFETDAEGILVIDAASARVLEANSAARAMLDLTPRRLVGQPFGAGFPEPARRALADLMARVRNSGRSEATSVRLGPPSAQTIQASASLLMHEQKAQVLLRLYALADAALAGPHTVPAQALAQVPDGIVLTDLDGRVVQANAAFVEFTQLASADQVQGETIGRWLGRGAVDLNVMLSALRQQGVLRMFATVLNGEHGGEADVEVSGGASGDDQAPGYAFVVRHVGRRLSAERATAAGSPRSVEQLTQLVGRMPLKDLVRESSDLIEQLSIEAALQLTQGNRAAAAEMLGLSRQSLYVKLHRYGIGELGDARRG